MAFLITRIAFDRAEILIALLLVFLSNSSITAYCRDVEGLVLLISLVQTKFFFRKPTQGFARLAVILIIIVSGREMVLLSLRVFLVLRFFVF